MAVTAADIKFFAPQTLTDNADGGGPRSSALLQTGVANTMFPDVSSADRLTGRTRIRKMYPSVTNADTAALLGASVAINEVLTDAAVNVSVFAFGNAASTTRVQAATAIESVATLTDLQQMGTAPAGGGTLVQMRQWDVTFTTGGTVITFPLNYDSGSDRQRVIAPLVGAEVVVSVNGLKYIRVVTARTEMTEASAGVWTGSNTVTVAPMPTYAATSNLYWPVQRKPLSGPRIFGYTNVPLGLTSGAIYIFTASTSAQIAPWKQGAVYPTTNNGVDPAPFVNTLGRTQIVYPFDVVTLWHEASTTAATASNGGTVNVGRTDLDQLAVVGADGKEIARFLAGGPTPTPTSGAVSANLTTGVVTFTTVTGWTQPVTVRHRISHRSAVSAVDGTKVTLDTAITRDFPAGAVLSTHLPLGDIQATVYGSFGQQAWTRVWSDTPIGNSISQFYTGSITVTNRGAETDRWVIVATNGNTFDLYSERLGRVASGDTATNFAPINPATGAPFLTLLATNWAGALPVGGAQRFNTTGASAPVWMIQCIAPSVASGTTRTALRLHGSV